MSRTYDIALQGATGFTGRQAARYLAAHAPPDLRIVLSGRDRAALERVRASLAPREIDVRVAEASDTAALAELAASARVVASTAGPFARYGSGLVAACVAAGTDYVDITGETPWVRGLIERHHDDAARAGVRIVPFCGFDSVPSDLGVSMVVEALRARGTATASVTARFAMQGGLNGGTLASALALGEDGARSLGDVLLLNPPMHHRDAERGRSADRTGVDRVEGLGWLAPFVMAPVNTRVVRRSNALLDDTGEAYGPTFRYDEGMAVSSWGAGQAVRAGLASFDALLRSRAGRAIVRAVAPAPGQGPSEASMDGGWFRVRLLGVGDDGQRVVATVSDRGDPGNRATVKMLCEAALLLARTPREDLPGGVARGGVLTPATALGGPYLARLRAAGMVWTVDETQA